MKAIAIDGPAGAGKSTIARETAQKLGFIYVDTGALYRTIALAVLERGISPKDTEQILALLEHLKIELKYLHGEQRVYLNERDVSEKIRTPEVSSATSLVSAIDGVRTFLFSIQQDIAANHSVVMDGRDIGTVVLPNADLKIFLTATAEERAKRRFHQLTETGEQVDFDQLLADIKQRDNQDANRKIAPLKQAEDAILVDTTGETLEQSIKKLEQVIAEHLK